MLPETGRVLATVRTTDSQESVRVADALTSFATSIAAAFGCQARTTYTQGEPALINDAALVDQTDRALHRVGLDPTEPMRSLGADDFSFYGQSAPTLMCFVGVDCAPGTSLHHPRFVPDDGAVSRVARTMVAGYLGAARLITEQEPTT